VTNQEPESGEPDDLRWLDRIIRLAVVGGLLAWSFLIVQPFVGAVVWGGILAVALYPLFARLERALGGRRKTAAGAFVLLVVALLAAPTALLTDTLVRGVDRLDDAYEAGTLRIPPPPADLHTWPLVGERLSGTWQLAHDDLQAAIRSFGPQLEAARRGLVAFARNASLAVFEMVFSLVVMAVFFATARETDHVLRSFGVRIAGADGDALISLARDTTRSVARGIVGVALIQGLLAGLGCFAAGVPAAGLWALLVLVLSVAQLSPIFVLGPVAAYLFGTDTPMWIAVAFTVWSVVVSLIDNVLKPILLGQGVAAPMLVVFLGAIGGLLHAGVVGLFVGPVILVVTFTVVRDWMGTGAPGAPTGATDQATARAPSSSSEETAG